MPDLAARSDALELMDTETVPFAEFDQCLRHLAAINRLTGAYRPTLQWLDRMLAAGPPLKGPLVILDVGFGYGDMLRRIARWAGARGIPVRLLGIDLNPWSAKAAAAVTPPQLPISFHTGDVFAWDADQPVDVVLSALFTHHLPDPDLVRFLRWMTARARRGWFVNDLHRHAIAHGAVRGAAGVLPVNRLVKHDAPLSVARAFTRADWQRLIAAAGLPPHQVSVRWVFPFRYGVGWTA